MSIVVVGSVAYDDLETPAGRRERVLGGAATHFSTAASFFSKIHLVGVVGSDFAHEHVQFLSEKGVDLEGLMVVPNGTTFSWKGHYLNDLNQAETLKTELGVFATFDPKLSEQHRESPYLFLANIHPQLQLKVLNQMQKPRLTAMDTMNLWIDTTRDELQEVIERVDLIFVNDAEAKSLTGEGNIRKAAQCIRNWGPRIVVIKRGEHGSLLFLEDRLFTAPAFPLAEVKDPTGAGDTFAGGFLGYLAQTERFDEATFRRAIICGSVMASFQVEDFGLERLTTLTERDIECRFAELSEMTSFEPAPIFSQGRL